MTPSVQAADKTTARIWDMARRSVMSQVKLLLLPGRMAFLVCQKYTHILSMGQDCLCGLPVLHMGVKPLLTAQTCLSSLSICLFHPWYLYIVTHRIYGRLAWRHQAPSRLETWKLLGRTSTYTTHTGHISRLVMMHWGLGTSPYHVVLL